MNEIQQNAIDLVVGLREMKWDRLEQGMLESVPDNFDCARPSDWGMPTWVLDEQRRLAQQKKALIFANEDTTHLPQQVRKQIAFIIGDYYV